MQSASKLLQNKAMSLPPKIHRLDSVTPAQINQLCNVLIDCVEGGASISFMLPMTREKAERFWRDVAEGVANNERILLVAQNERGEIVGTVQGCSRSRRISCIALIFRR